MGPTATLRGTLAEAGQPQCPLLWALLRAQGHLRSTRRVCRRPGEDESQAAGGPWQQHSEELKAGWLQGQTWRLQSGRARAREGALCLGLMLCSCHLESLSDFVFELEICK